jgi:hypothetical protein
MSLCSTKPWNSAAKLPAFSATKPGIGFYIYSILIVLKKLSRADYITEVKMIKTGQGVQDVS